MPTEALPLDGKQLGAWKTRLEASKSLREEKKEGWKEYLSAYLGKPLTALPASDTIIVNKEFSFVEQKRAQLAFQQPEVQTKAKRPGLEQPALLMASVINQELGMDGANVKTMLDESTADTLIFGLGPTKIGYSATMGIREVQVPIPDPMTGQPMADPMTGQPAMTVEQRPIIIHEEYFWRSISPDKFLMPAEFEGFDFDQATWLAWEFEKDWELAKREYGLEDGEQVSRTQPSMETLSGEKESIPDRGPSEIVKGTEIWYRAAMFDPDAEDHQGHPEALRVMVMLEGRDSPVRHEPSPYQRWVDGKLTGMMGFPLHPLTLRSVRGSGYPPSDVEMMRPLCDELSKGRTQMIRQRDTSIPIRWVDINRMPDPAVVEKLRRGEYGGVIGLQGNGNEAIGEVARANFPRENFTFDEIVNRDLEELTALGRNQRGVLNDTQKTATEVNVAQGAADVRLDSERARLLDWYVRGARKFASLLQMFKTDEGYVQILGQDAKGLQPWDRTRIQGEYVFSVKPDSAIRIDAAADRAQALNLYQLLANDPQVNRMELLKSVLLRHNLDPSKVVVETPPQKGVEPPRVSVTLNGDALAAPSPMLLEVLKQAGMQITPPMVQQTQTAQMVRSVAASVPPSPPHPGAVAEAEPLSKHQLRQDGRDGRMGTM